MKRKILYSIGKNILKILALSAVATAAMVAPNIVQVIQLFQKKNPKLKKYSAGSLRMTLYRLRNQKLIYVGQKEKETIVKITQKGQARVLQYKIEEMQITKPKIWDKKWRIVIFDIPTTQKLARDVLRDKLKNLGFYQLQKSVWLYPFECRDEIEFIREVYEVSPYVKFIVAKEIEDEDLYIKYFKLK